MKTMKQITLSLIFFLYFSAFAFSNPSHPTHGISLYGDLKYGKNFKHFNYVNPNALKGGLVSLADSGGFDSLNPYIIKGNPAPGSNLLHCTLMTHSQDEPFSLYPYLAESVELAPDQSGITFKLNKKAIFSDGSPVTAEDVIFTFRTLINKGAPFYKAYYGDIENVEKINSHTVKFIFKNNQNKELPLIIGEMPIFSKKYYSEHDFKKASLTPPVGCGPYKVKKINPGAFIKYSRIPQWWGEKIPSQLGQHNFDIAYKNYRDLTVSFQGFKAGETDFRQEYVAKNWATEYDFPAVKKGEVIIKEAEVRVPKGMQMFLYNTRRPIFADPKIREALIYAFDFNWLNKNIFFNSYDRSTSYFNNSNLTASGLPEGEELEILKKYRNQLPEKIFTQPITLPENDALGRNRKNLAIADKLLKEAGWIVKDGRRVHKKTGKPFHFVFLNHDPIYERVILALNRNLKALGIKMDIRTVTPSEYIERAENFDFDMLQHIIPQSESPGNEQRDLWGSLKANTPNTRNLAGVQDPIVDELIELVIKAPDRQALVARAKALDRILMWGFYGIPGWYTSKVQYAYWNKFGQPSIKPKDGVGLTTWWVNPKRNQSLKLKK